MIGASRRASRGASLGDSTSAGAENSQRTLRPAKATDGDSITVLTRGRFRSLTLTLPYSLRLKHDSFKGLMNPNDVVEIYQAYPRKIARRFALREIERAIRRLEAGENGSKMDYETAAFELLKATCLYARSPAGNRGTLTPHPTTWFRQSRYLDDPNEWQHVTPEESKEIKRQMEANVGVYRPT